MMENSYLANDEIKSVLEKTTRQIPRNLRVEALRYLTKFNLNEKLSIEMLVKIYFKIKNDLVPGDPLANPEMLVPLILWASSNLLGLESTEKEEIIRFSNIPITKLNLYKIRVSELLRKIFG